MTQEIKEIKIKKQGRPKKEAVLSDLGALIRSLRATILESAYLQAVGVNTKVNQHSIKHIYKDAKKFAEEALND